MSGDRRALLALFAIALGLRILYGAFAASELDAGPETPSRELSYAEHIASGFDWARTPQSPQSPGYPVVLALLYLLSAKHLWLTFFLQAALSSLAIIVLYATAKPLIGSRWASGAALWLALSVHHMHYTSVFARDVLVVLLLLLLVMLLTRPLKRMLFGLLSGAVYAALFHVDPQYMVLFPVFAVVILFSKSRHTILKLQYLFLFVIGLFVTSLPWTIRNQVVYHQPLPVGLEAVRYLRPLRVMITPDETMSAVERRMDRASRSGRFETNTVEFWRITRWRDGTSTDLTRGEPRVEPAWSLRHNLMSAVSYGLLLPFMLLGIVVALRKGNRSVLMIALVILSVFVLRSYLGGSDRTRFPVEPLIILVAFYGAASLGRFVRRSTGDATAPASAQP